MKKILTAFGLALLASCAPAAAVEPTFTLSNPVPCAPLAVAADLMVLQYGEVLHKSDPHATEPGLLVELWVNYSLGTYSILLNDGTNRCVYGYGQDDSLIMEGI